jgi:NADH-quinone oxidoreductase subunit A
MNPYIPVIIVLIFGVVLGGILSGLAAFLGPKKYSREKMDPYECGVPKVTAGSEKMSVKFYLTAILFILFDIETVFLYLWARTFKELGWLGIIEIAVFVLILVVGYIYVVRRGALEWD